MMRSASNLTVAVDAGHTRLKWCLAVGERSTARALARGAEAAGDYPRLVAAVCDAVRASAGPGAAAGTRDDVGALHWWIAEPAAAGLRAALTAAGRASDLVREVRVPDPGSAAARRLGWRSEYAADQLGVDRFLALLGVLRRFGADGDAWVIDAGTAMTLDRLAAGCHRGGLIVPGLAASWAGVAARVPWLDAAWRPPEGAGAAGDAMTWPRPHSDATRSWPRTSEAALRAGVLTAAAAVIERCVRADPARVVLTGGDAALLAPALRSTLQQAADDRDARVDVVVISGSALIFDGLRALIAADAERG